MAPTAQAALRAASQTSTATASATITPAKKQRARNIYTEKRTVHGFKFGSKEADDARRWQQEQLKKVIHFTQPDFHDFCITQHEQMCAADFYGPLSPARLIDLNVPDKDDAAPHDDNATKDSNKSVEFEEERTSSREESDIEDDSSRPPKRARATSELPFTQSQTSRSDAEGDSALDDKDKAPPSAKPTTPPSPSQVNELLEAIGDVKADVVVNLHWMATTVFLGSISAFLSTIDERNKSLRIKKAMKSATAERKANFAAAMLARERPQDRATVLNLVDTQMDSKLAAQDRRIQSIEDKLHNQKQASQRQQQRPDPNKQQQQQ